MSRGDMTPRLTTTSYAVLAQVAVRPWSTYALAVDFFISLLNTVEAWAQRTLDEIESWDDLSPNGKNERALEKLRELPAPTPGSIETTPVPPRTQRQRHRRA